MKILTTNDFVIGRIPRKEDFPEALKEFEEECILPFLGKEVLGSFAYGSVNRDDCNVASDIDYFAVISDNSHKQKIRDATRNAFNKREVYVQTRVIHIDHARNGFHSLDSSFRQHLSLSVKNYGFKGVNPLELLASNNVPFKEALRKSISVYLMKLNNGFTTYPISEEERVDFLKDIMEKPFHAMRVAVQYFNPELDSSGVFYDTKGELMNVYNTLGLDPKLSQDMDKLSFVGREYIKLLEKRQANKIHVSQMFCAYSDILDKIEDCYPEAFHFVEENAKLMVGNEE